MKLQKLTALIFLLAMGAVSATAQYDDLYYNPDTDGEEISSYAAQKPSRSYTATQSERDPRRSGETSYDDEPYDYYYTSRIRRFHRPMYGFDYFDPYYIDAYYYDPFLFPGRTMFIYDMPFAYRSMMRRMAFYDPFWYSRPGWGYPGWGAPGWGVRPGFAFSAGIGFGFGSGFYGSGFYPSFGFGSGFYGGGFYGGALYCPPSYYNGVSYGNAAYAENSVVSSRPRINSARSVAPATGLDRDPRTSSTRPSVGRTIARDNPGLRTSDRMREIRRQAGTDARSRARLRTAGADRASTGIRTRTAPSSRLYDRATRQTTSTRTFRTPTTTRQRTATPSWNNSRRTTTPSRSFNTTRSSSRPTVSPRSSGSSSRSSAPRSSSSSRRGNNE